MCITMLASSVRYAYRPTVFLSNKSGINTLESVRCVSVLKLIVRVLLRIRVGGDLTQLAGGPALVIANHDAWLDGALLGLSCRGRRAS